MSFWIIASWVLVAVLTAVNIVVFLKLKEASEQMLKMAFPGSKNMGEALQRMQQMMGGMGGRGGPFGGGGNSDQQLRAAMDMLKNLQQKKR